MSSNQNTAKINSFQGLRSIAFLAIFFCHAGLTYSNLGGWGVSVFLVLSGYLLALRHKDLKCDKAWSAPAFSFNHIKKLYPLHILMLLLGLFGGLTLNLLSHNEVDFFQTGKFFVVDSFLLQSWIPIRSWYYSINGVSWYLSTIAFLYFTFPYVNKILRRASVKAYIIMLLLLPAIQYGLSLAFLRYNLGIKNDVYLWAMNICPLYRFIDFFSGIILGMLCQKTNKTITTNKLAFYTIIEIVILFASFAGVWILEKENDNAFVASLLNPSIVFLPTSCLLVFLFGRKEGALTRALSTKIFVFIGNISGYAFLIHQLMIQYSKLLISKLVTLSNEIAIKMLSSGIAFIVTVVLSLLYMFILEKNKKRYYKNENSAS